MLAHFHKIEMTSILQDVKGTILVIFLVGGPRPMHVSPKGNGDWGAPSDFARGAA